MTKKRKLLDVSVRAVKKRFNSPTVHKNNSESLHQEIFPTSSQKSSQLKPEEFSVSLQNQLPDLQPLISNLPLLPSKEAEISNLCEDVSITNYVRESLQTFACDFNVSRTGVNFLLKKLSNLFPLLPTDYRSLLATPRETNARIVNPGKYVHFGLDYGLRLIFDAISLEKLSILSTVSVNFFVDGVNFFNLSQNNSFWIILGRVSTIEKSVFPIGLYNGHSKPSSFDDLLSDFVAELKIMLSDGIFYKGRKINITIGLICLDTPARADVCGIAHHNNYYSCPKCIIKGYYQDGRFIFDSHSLLLRSNESFKFRVNPEFHKRSSIMETVPGLKMIDQFPLDYMHVVLFGVVKKWVKSTLGPKKPLFPQCRAEINKVIELANCSLPAEIHKKLRPINEIGTFKASELRVLLLKVAPIAFRHKLPSDYYLHFMLLTCAFTILCDKEFCIKKNRTANQLLILFFDHCGEYFGSTFYTQMVHQTTHMADEVLKYQIPVDEFSTFAFENYLTPIRRLIHTPNLPLSQIFRRIVEIVSAAKNSRSNAKNSTVTFGKKCSLNDNEFYSATINQLKIDVNKSGDKYVLCKDKRVCLVLKILKNGSELMLKVQQLNQLGDIFDVPLPSRLLNFYWCKQDTLNEQEIIHIRSIDRKLFPIKLNGEIFFSPLERFSF